MSEELVQEVPSQMEEVNVPEMPVQEPVKFDPSKKYQWDSKELFVLNGSEFGLILNALRAQLATEEAARILLASRANAAVENILGRAVEAGIVKEDTDNQ